MNHHPKHVPRSPRVFDIRIRHRKEFHHTMATALATFSAVVPSDAVSSRTSYWSVIPAGATTPVLTTNTLPASAITDSIPSSPGDVVSFYLVDTNSVGDSAPSNTVTATDPTPPPTAVPTTPTVTGVTFS
jgi:hypothetical protein